MIIFETSGHYYLYSKEYIKLDKKEYRVEEAQSSDVSQCYIWELLLSKSLEFLAAWINCFEIDPYL